MEVVQSRTREHWRLHSPEPEKLCGLELKKVGGCIVWKQRKLEPPPEIGNAQMKSESRRGWRQQKPGVEGEGRAGWPLGRLRAQSEVAVGGGLSQRLPSPLTLE